MLLRTLERAASLDSLDSRAESSRLPVLVELLAAHTRPPKPHALVRLLLRLELGDLTDGPETAHARSG